jgi:ATP-dependent Clp protease ATP-binding subunit ClpA
MDLNKFTEKSQTALTEAQAIGTHHQHQAVDVEHLALGLLEQEEGLVPGLLQKAGVSPDLVKEKLQEALDRIPRVSVDTMTGQGLYVTQRLNRLLVAAQDEAKKLKDDYVSVEHLVDQILHERVVGQDEAVQAVADAVIRTRSGLKDPRATFTCVYGWRLVLIFRYVAPICITPST